MRCRASVDAAGWDTYKEGKTRGGLVEVDSDIVSVEGVLGIGEGIRMSLSVQLQLFPSDPHLLRLGNLTLLRQLAFE